jgi:HD-like signal output (HDOD) protein
MMEDSADVAVCASELAQHVQGVTPDEAYTCGLFHNCGSILLMIKDPEHYHDLFFKSYTFPLKAIEKEEELFDTNHTVTGLVLANKWNLDKNIISAIYQHHIMHCMDIENEKTRLLVGLLKVANGIVAEVSLGAYISKEMKDYMQDGVNTLMLEYNHLVDARLALHNYRIGL